jgi:hypothetical protein
VKGATTTYYQKYSELSNLSPDKRMENFSKQLALLIPEFLNTVSIDAIVSETTQDYFACMNNASQKVMDLMDANFCYINDVKLMFRWMGIKMDIFDIYQNQFRVFTFSDFMTILRSNDKGYTIIFHIVQALDDLVLEKKKTQGPLLLTN